MAFSMDRVRLDGCKFGPPSARDFRTVFKDLDIPNKVDLRPYCTPVESQGDIGSCTANAVVGALEYHLKCRDGRSVDLSRMFVYYNTRRMTGHVHADSGAQIREAMASILAFGACSEEVWPYDPSLFAEEPPPQSYSDALKYEGIQYARLGKGDSILRALAKGFPVVFGGAFPRCCYEELKDGWIMPQPTEEQFQQKLRQGGGHAMLIVGYDRNEQMYIVRNSWGEEWGERGYCKMPFGVADMCSGGDEFWIVSELEQLETPATFTLIQPGREKRTEESRGRVPEMRTGGMAGIAATLRDEIRSGLEADIASSSRKVDSLMAGRAAQRRQTTDTVKAAGVCWACGGTGACAVCHGRGCGYCKQGLCGSCNGHGAT
jgi:hypothetical protein